MAAGGRPAKRYATQAPGEGTVPETEKGKQPSASPIMKGERGVGWTIEPGKGGAAGNVASLQARAEGKGVFMTNKEVLEAAPAATLTFGDFPAISTAESSHSAGVSLQAPPARDQPTRPEATSAASFGSQREAASPPPTSSAAFPAHHHPPVPRTTPPATTTAGAAVAAATARATPSVVPPAALAFGHESDGPDSYGSASPAAAAADEEAIVELVGMGFDREHVVRALKECGRGESWKEAAISLLLEPQVSSLADAEERLSGNGRQGAAAMQGYADAAPTASQSPCPVCFEDIQAGEVFTVDCKEQHTFCVDCLHHHCRVQLLDSALIPACPLSTMKCGHELGQEEVERVFLLKSYSSASAGGKDGGDTTGVSEEDRRALDTCRNLLTRRGLESTGAIPCVSPECGNWMVPEGGVQRVKCASCLVEFCSRCKRSPYHYAAECDEVVCLSREWSHWLSEGKATFLGAMAAQDDQHRALLDRHNRRKEEHDRAVKEAERVRLEYERMEEWKEKRCRCCPSCGRTIEKLSGCDSMVCGVDAHGGNVQNGCGKSFLWSRARPYRGDRGECKATPFTEQEPAAAARSRHFIADGIALRCDRCHRDVVGPLFRCVHCPSFACCLECQDVASNDPHHVHHIFRVVNGDTEKHAFSPETGASAAVSRVAAPPDAAAGNIGQRARLRP
ncbi:unnamed protein product [Ectocarpus sp. 12 AP-2014]